MFVVENVLLNYIIVHFDLPIIFFVELIDHLLNDVIILLNYYVELHEKIDKNVHVQHYLIDDAILRHDY